MSSERLETVKLTARFKLDGEVNESLFEVFRAIVNDKSVNFYHVLH